MGKHEIQNKSPVIRFIFNVLLFSCLKRKLFECVKLFSFKTEII